MKKKGRRDFFPSAYIFSGGEGYGIYLRCSWEFRGEKISEECLSLFSPGVACHLALFVACFVARGPICKLGFLACLTLPHHTVHARAGLFKI